MKKDVKMKVTRTIKVNHVEAVEQLLQMYDDLVYVNLEKNRSNGNVRRLIRMLPRGHDCSKLMDFYRKTGLKVQVRVCLDGDIAVYDKDGTSPREEADIIIFYRKDPI